MAIYNTSGKVLSENKNNSKIITATRSATGSDADVHYEVGFKPKKITCLSYVDGNLYCSNGIGLEDKTNRCIYQSSANVFHEADKLVCCSNYSSWAQNATIKSFDEKGFTLNWHKIGVPMVNTINLIFICE